MDFKSRFAEKRLELAKVSDALGAPLEAGIFDMVAVLQVAGFPTTMSCEGHVGWGCPSPWIDVGVKNFPEFQLVGEKEKWAEIIASLDFDEDDLRPSEWEKAYDVLVEWKKCARETVGMAEDFLEATQIVQQFSEAMRRLIREFEHGYDMDDLFIVMTLRGKAGFRLYIDGPGFLMDDVTNLLPQVASDEGRMFRLAQRQKVMQDFGGFIRGKLEAGKRVL